MPGIEFQLFHLTRPRPINLFVTRMQRSEPSVTIDSALAQGALTSGREKVSEMAARYDQAINYWGEVWGNRNRVVVAINGYYFNLGNGVPLSGQIHSGWYMQRFSDYVGDAGFAWTLYRQAFIGKCVYHTPRDQFLTVLRSGETKKIGGLNRGRENDELVLYTPQFGASTLTDNSGLEILVEMSRPSLVLPEPAMAIGRVVRIRDLRGDSSIPFDHVVLSASGVVRTSLLEKLVQGDEIGISQEISNCPASPQNDWTKSYAAIGGDYHFLTGGALTIDSSNPDALVPNSRTAVAYNADYVFFIVADGWNRGVSEGITIAELGLFALETLQATDAVTLDSGGSSTMVINGQVVNNTYCNFTRQCGMRSEEGAEELLEEHREAQRLSARPPAQYSPALEPMVGNALMMVVVEPKVQSKQFLPGQEVIIRQVSELRLGPGANYAALTSLPAGTAGEALGMHYQDLNGIYAKGAFWQRIKAGNLSGWVRQDALIGLPPPWLPRFYFPIIRR